MVNLKETFPIIFLGTQRRDFKLFYSAGFKYFYTFIFYLGLLDINVSLYTLINEY